MIKKIPLLFDIHATDDSVAKPYKIVKKFLKKEKPTKTGWHEIIIGGDFGEFESVSHWLQDQRKNRTLEGKRYKKECEVLNKELDFIKDISRKTTYLYGNHEDWIDQYIEKHPEHEGILELENMLDLSDVNVIPFNDLYQIGNVYLTHGMWTNKYHTNKHMRLLGCNLIYGHVHTYQVWTQNMAMQEPYMTMSIGCLCDKAPNFMKGRPANWLNQFGILYIDTKTGNFDIQTINIIDNQFIYNGKKWK